MWLKISELLPPAGDLVEGQYRNGKITTLVRLGSRWYTNERKEIPEPIYWRYINVE